MAAALKDQRKGQKKEHQFSFKFSLCDTEILYIWEHVSCYIAKQLQSNKGVSIQGFGTFTISRQNLKTGEGDGRYVQLNCPVFNLHKQYAITHDLQFHNCFVPGSTPILPLNLSSIAYQSRVGRDHVENCTREIIRCVSHAVACSKKVDFCFLGIGRLTFRKGRVKMKFCREFIKNMDCSGQLLNSLLHGPALKDTSLLDSCSSNCGTIVIPNIEVTPNDTTGLVVLRKQKKVCEDMKCSCENDEPLSCFKTETEKMRPLNKDHRMVGTKLQKDYYTRMSKGCCRTTKIPKTGSVNNDSVQKALRRSRKVCTKM